MEPGNSTIIIAPNYRLTNLPVIPYWSIDCIDSIDIYPHNSFIKSTNRSEKDMNTITINITIDQNNETLVFTLKPLIDFNEFIDEVSLIESVECLTDGEEMGLWEVM